MESAVKGAEVKILIPANRNPEEKIFSHDRDATDILIGTGKEFGQEGKGNTILTADNASVPTNCETNMSSTMVYSGMKIITMTAGNVNLIREPSGIPVKWTTSCFITSL